MADYKDNNDVAQAARVTGERDIVSASTLLKWAVEGKVFEAGFSPEDSAIDSAASFADTTPSFGLKSPNSSSLIVIPILLNLMMNEDGGALSQYSIGFTKPAGLCATAHTLTGTAMASKHSMYQTNPAQTTQQAEALYTCTQSAMVAADYIMPYKGQVIDAALSTGLVNVGGGPSNVKEFNFLKDGVPHLMTSGACMVVYTYTATSDSMWYCYMQWAEVTIDDLR